MKSKIKSILLAFVAVGMFSTGFGVVCPQGGCARTAVTLRPGATKLSRTVSLVQEVDESVTPAEYTGYYCYNFALPLNKGSQYTFTVKFNNDKVYDAMLYFADASAPEIVYVWPDPDVDAGTINAKYIIRKADWQNVSADTVTLYAYIYGEQGGQAVFTYHAALDIEVGTVDNPEPLEVPLSGTNTKNITLKAAHDGAYHYVAELLAGKKYTFSTVDGSETAGWRYLDIEPYSVVSEPPIIYELTDVDAYNGGFSVIPGETGDYHLVVGSEVASATLRYGGVESRRPSEHDNIRVLENGVRQTCVPGKKHANQSYYDEVIDTQLFSFTAVAGGRYLVETDGAAMPILLEAYDANGTLLAANSASETNNANCRIAFEVPSAGTYYVGLCEDLEDEEAYELSDLSVGVTLRNITGETDGLDEYDPGDDTALKASPLAPPLTADFYVSPSAIDEEGHGPHRLSANDWQDTFVIACRAGLLYDVQFLSATTNGNILGAEVFTMDGNGGEVPVDSRFYEDMLSFDASANAAHYVRLFVMSARGEVGHGLDYPDYMAHCVARSTSAAQYGYLTVGMQGPASSSGATWRITGGTSAVEPQYPFGSTITEKGTLTIEASEVDGFSTPASQTITIQPGASTNLLFVYNDSYDPQDDARAGAFSLAFEPTAKSLDRTLWGDDSGDWFSFAGEQGKYYNIAFSEVSGTPRISVQDANGNLLAQSDEKVSVAAPQTGTYYVLVDHGAPGDASYQLSYSSVNVGTVGFVNGGAYTVREDAPYIEIPVARSSAEGAISVRYGTVADMATAGADYSPAAGVLKWAAGESAAKTIRVNLLPEGRPTYEGNERFFLKLEAGTPDDAGEYAPVISAPDVATITLTDSSSPASAGTVSITGAGDGKAAITNGTVTVAPGETVRIWVSRSDGTNGRAECWVAPTDGTATADVDYYWGGTPCRIGWESGEGGDRCVMFGTSSDVKAVKHFTVKIADLSGDGYEAPVFGTRTVRVVIDPGAPAPVYEETALQSAAGSFMGILRERTGYGEEARTLSKLIVNVSPSAISATLTVAGTEINFSGTGFDSISNGFARATLVRQQTIDGVVYDDTLTLRIPKVSLASYEEEFQWGVWNEGTATAQIHVPNADGITADEYLYLGDLHRDNTALPLFATSVAPFAGKYTVAFVPRELPLETEPKGLSVLSLTVAADGTVAGTGVLANGTEVSVASKASVVVSPAYLQDGQLVVPIYCGTETVAFGGELSILYNDGTPVVHSGDEDWDCFLLGCSDAASTELNESGFTASLMPIGGSYDDTVSRAFLAIGKDYSVDSGEWTFVDTNDTSCARLTTNANGIVTGTITLASGSYQVNGVEIMNREPGLAATFGNISIAGRIAVPTNVAGGRTWMDSYPLYVREIDEDPDWTEDFGLSATITFNGNGNTEGYAPAAISAQVKSTEFIPEVDTNSFRRAGYEFVCWRDEGGADYVAGDEFLVPVSNTTLTAVWTFSVAGVPEALDCAENTNLVFVAGGDAPWIPQTAVTHGTPSAIQSGAIGTEGGTSWIETRVQGSGRLSFWYKCETFQGMDKLTVTIDGAVAGTYSGTVDWTKFECDIASGGAHTVRWTYSRTTSWNTDIANSAWVDELQFGPTVTVTFDPTIGTMAGERSVQKVVGTAFGTLPRPESETMTFDYWRDGDGTRYTADTPVPDHDVALTAEWKDKEWEVRFEGGAADSGDPPEVQTGLPGAEIVLPGPGTLRKNGYEFVGWSDGTTTRTNGATYVVGTADVTMTAQWSLSVAGIGEALDASELVYSAGGDVPWFAQTAVTHGTPSAIQSGAIGTGGGTSWIETQVEGAGQLSFWYKCTTYQNMDKLTVTIDGTVAGTYSGTVDWTRFEHEFTSGGTHTVRWTYSRTTSWDTGIANSAWVDELQFGPTVTVTFDPTIGTMAGERSVQKVVGTAFGTLPRPESETMTFDYWRDGDGTRYAADTVVPDHDVALTAEWKDKEWEVRFAGGAADSGDPPEVQTGLPGAEIVLPGPGTLRKNGYEFVGWSDGTTTRTNGATYVVGTADVTMTAQWSLSVAGIGEALDASELVYSAGGDVPWFAQTAVTHGTPSAIQSGAIGTGGGTSWIETQVEGTGQLSFWYKCATFQGMDKLTVTIDGTVVGTYSGTVDWTRFEHEFTSGGTHTVRWTYSRTTSWDTGIANSVWVDELQFGPTVTVTFDTVGGIVAEVSRTFLVGSKFSGLPVPTLADAEFLGWKLDGVLVEEGVTEVPATDSTLVAQWRFDDRTVSFAAGEGTGLAPDPVSGQPFTEVVLPVQGMLVAPEGHVFAGWSDGAVLYLAGDRYEIGTSNVTLTAQWSYAVTGYAEALDSDAPIYTAGGNSAWYMDSAVYDASVPGNGSSLRSGAVPFSSGVTWCQAQVSGAGSLSFRWKISALSYNNCHFKVTVDGAEVLSRDGGVTDWQESAAMHLDEGVHVVRWTYSTDWGWDDASVQNCAWIDNLVWTPDVQPGTKAAVIAAVTEPAAGMTLEATKQAVSDQIDSIIAAGASESNAVAWIEANKFTGAEIATAKAIDVSYGIGAGTLFANDPVGVISAMSAAEPADGHATAYGLTFQLKDGADGPAVAVAATDAAKAYVVSLVKVTTDLGDWSEVPENLVEATYNETTENVSVKVSLHDMCPSAFSKIGN